MEPINTIARHCTIRVNCNHWCDGEWGEIIPPILEQLCWRMECGSRVDLGVVVSGSDNEPAHVVLIERKLMNFDPGGEIDNEDEKEDFGGAGRIADEAIFVGQDITLTPIDEIVISEERLGPAMSREENKNVAAIAQLPWKELVLGVFDCKWEMSLCLGEVTVLMGEMTGMFLTAIAQIVCACDLGGEAKELPSIQIILEDLFKEEGKMKKKDGKFHHSLNHKLRTEL